MQLLITALLIILTIGCASYDNLPKCDYICPVGSEIPTDCYCLLDISEGDFKQHAPSSPTQLDFD